ncbi:MAG: hypothetical protein JW840_07870 [Candidatus Thermoplasmatota archaeon]|nr:hypothetical protein [Candidatus Thermoplasmatota archaeon]
MKRKRIQEYHSGLIPDQGDNRRATTAIVPMEQPWWRVMVFENDADIKT